MDLIGTVKVAFNKVTKRQNQHHSVSQLVIDQVCDEIKETLSQIQLHHNGVESQQVLLTKLKLKLDSFSPIVQLQESQKEINTNLNKFVKLLENSYSPDISQACRNIDFDIHQVNRILIEHLYRKGLFEIGDCLAKEAEVESETKVSRSQSLEIIQLTESMKLKNIEPTMKWISNNREKLKENSSSKLELKLISLKYCDMLREGGGRNQCNDVLSYARSHFPQYGSSLHWKEIKKLFTALMWCGKLENFPNTEMVSSLDWNKITKEIITQYYNLLDKPSKCSLEVALSAGLESLPRLLKVIKVMGLKKEEWELMKVIPYPMELSNEFQFHSVFVCPVSKDESNNEENPAMMMVCGHVLCKESIMKISKNRYRRFKCPYCPSETSAAACKQLYF